MLTDQQLSRSRWPAVIVLVLYFAYFYLEILRRRMLPVIDEYHQADFYHFYQAALAMNRGEDIYLSGTHGYVYPPLLAFLYLPLAHVSDRAAVAIAFTINVLLMIAAVLVSARAAAERLIIDKGTRHFTPGLLPLIAALTALLTFGRVKAELAIKQVDVVVLAAYILGIYWLDRRPALAGAVLGLALNIKYYTLPALLYLLLRRRWRAASWFCISALFFACLPAVRVGLHTDLQYLSIAFGGVLKSVGVQTNQTEAAHVHKIYEALSLSITSGISRMLLHSRPKLAMPLTAGVILLFVIIAMYWYRQRRLPLFLWPDRTHQQAWPYRQLALLEWAGLMIGSIAFSPDSNLRHMVLVLFPNAIAVTLLLGGRERRIRAPLIVGLCLELYALDLFGDIHGRGSRLTELFFFVGGQGWGLLIFYGIVLWAGLQELSFDRSPASALAQTVREL